jgi:F-type H+-transporting ATPase subunit c
MTFALRVFLVLAVVVLVTPGAFAQPAPPAPPPPNWAGLGAGAGMGLSIVGIGVGLGLIGFSALASIARQPEQAGKVQGVMYVLAALVEGAGIIAVLLCFLVAARIMG